VTRPRAADDFSAIRTRVEELRREREQLATYDESPLTAGPEPDGLTSRPALSRKPSIPPSVRRLLSRRAAT
jgi:hypothetical protein